MSWDVLVFNFQGNPPPPPESMDTGPKPPALGKADEVRKAISARRARTGTSCGTNPSPSC